MKDGLLLCKDCWTAHADDTTVLCLCTVCGGKRGWNRKRVLKGRYERTRGRDFVCSIHRNHPLKLYCGSKACDGTRELSQRAVVSDSGVVAVIGDSGSGKTTFLYVLRQALRPGRHATLQIRQAFGGSDEELAKETKSRTRQGDANKRNYAWELVANSGKGSWIVAFHDAAGGTWRDMGKVSTREAPLLQRFLDLVGGAIIIIDGGRLPADDVTGVYDESVQEAIAHELTIIDALAARLRSRRQPVRIAVTITKSDLLWDRPGGAVFRESSGASAAEVAEQVKSLLLKSGRRPLLEEIETIRGQVDYFAVSALGVEAASGDPDKAKPERLLEPLLKVAGIAPPAPPED